MIRMQDTCLSTGAFRRIPQLDPNDRSIRRLARLHLPTTVVCVLNCDELLRTIKGRRASFGPSQRQLSIADHAMTRAVGGRPSGIGKPTSGALVARTLSAR